MAADDARRDGRPRIANKYLGLMEQAYNALE